MWWTFNTQAEAEAAELQCRSALPPDVDIEGHTAPVQVTQRWADVVETLDGKFAFPVMPGQPLPEGAAEAESVSLPEPQSDF